ncbi:hypothetical protein N7520_005260 [Penicillium odoratum]|uniref:uncharacterized protein n=1 Tax=Penicillium odoratum TaxID=1167516 RepID=UPI002547CF1A|nr:uncharacterized protein N7520_005260 [Penicillium odoratum]KAJ5765701.1 hypothetical protein N7520_005260 [Penicillium odoratum]
MTYFQTEYRNFLASPRSAKLAANVSLIYVPSTTKFEGKDSVLTHLSRQSSIVKKKSEDVISSIEASDSLVLDMETTLEFLEGGGAYLPSLDDNFLADRVVTIPTLHIVHWNAEREIQQVRIYWDQGSLLKEVEIIGARSRSWPIRAGQEQTRLLRSAANAQSAPAFTPSQNTSQELLARPGSPGKRHITDPHGAGSLFNLLSPTKGESDEEEILHVPRPASPSKKYHKDPYGAGSLSEILSPSKAETATVRPYAPSAVKPPTRDLSDLFIDEEAPPTPSKAERVIAPKGGKSRELLDEDNLDYDRAPYKSNPTRFNHFEIGADNSTETKRRAAPKGDAVNTQDHDEDNLDHDRAPYKSNPTRFNHFDIGAADEEVTEKPQHGKSRNQSQWDFGDTVTPQKPRTEKARNFGYSDEDIETPPPRHHVFKPRRDADVHFEMNEDKEEDDGRVISSYQGRGQGLYQNRLFDDNGEAMPSEQETKDSAHLSLPGNNTNRQKNFDTHWKMGDSPAPKTDIENIPHDHIQSVKMMEASWDDYDRSPEPIRTATALHNPTRRNQPTWTYGDE